jgi:AraC family transcriptional regulator, positive regulator of tynA and feaB
MDGTEAGVSRAFDAFQRGWETEVGDDFPLPTFSPATTRDFRVSSRAIRVDDVAITDLHGSLVIRTEGPLDGIEDVVRMYVVQRGAWTLGGPYERREQAVPAGQFLLRHVGRSSHFVTMPDTVAKVLILPPAMLKPLLGGQAITGPADAAEVRLLVAHTNKLYETMADLGPAGVQAARSTLIELSKAVARRRFDDVEPLLAPALAQAAKDLADSRLADPELSAAMLARQLNVSVRTLQRAFSAAGDSVTGYIRQRRLEEARLALTAPSGRLSVTELAAHWQFADSSHFIRAFKKHYGRTPTDYARSVPSAGN